MSILNIESQYHGLNFPLALAGKQFATDAAKEVFEHLRPMNGRYKTNHKFYVGRKVVLSYTVEQAYEAGKFRPNYSREKYVNAIDRVFHLLDGAPFATDKRCDLSVAIDNCVDGKGETDYFKFKCFKNHNLHLEFKRLDLVKELNRLAAGEAVIGRDEP